MMSGRDLAIAVVLAVVFHGGIALVRIPAPQSPSIFTNKTIAISLVSHASPSDVSERIVPEAEKVLEPKEDNSPQVTMVRKKEKQRGTEKKIAEKTPQIKTLQQTEHRQPAEPVKRVPDHVTDAAEIEERSPLPSHGTLATMSGNLNELKNIQRDHNREIKPVIPFYKTNPSPPYPEIARRRGYEGTVLLSVVVAVDGSVSELTVQQSSGYSILDRAAMKTVVRWKFEPARRMGIPVPLRVEIPVRFVLKAP